MNERTGMHICIHILYRVHHAFFSMLQATNTIDPFTLLFTGYQIYRSIGATAWQPFSLRSNSNCDKLWHHAMCPTFTMYS